MTGIKRFEHEIDIIESVGGTVAMERRPVTAEAGFPVPHLTVTLGTKTRTWARPTFRGAFAEAVEWVADQIRD